MENMFVSFIFTHKSILVSLAERMLRALVIVITAKIISVMATKLIIHLGKTTGRIDETIQYILKMIVKYALFIVSLIMLLDIFGVNTTALIALLGTSGVAIGLALKGTLSNIAAGIMLIFLKSYRKDDVIEFGAFKGVVKRLDLFTTTLETAEGIVVSAPNSSIWAVPIKNHGKTPDFK